MVVSRSYHWSNSAATGCAVGECRLETSTTDGPGGSFFGFVLGQSFNASAGLPYLILPLFQLPKQRPYAPGLAVVAIGGGAAGQWRRIVSTTTNAVATEVAGIRYPPSYLTYALLDSPFNQPFDISTSPITVNLMKGKLTWEGNRFVNGTQVQTYGFALDVIVAGNSFENMTHPSAGHPLG